jgi:hypothetical protein
MTLQFSSERVAGPGTDPAIYHRHGSTDRFPIPTTPNNSADTLIVKNELRDRARDICVALEHQCAVIKDESLMIDPDCHDSMIFVWQTVPQHDDLHRIL